MRPVLLGQVLEQAHGVVSVLIDQSRLVREVVVVEHVVRVGERVAESQPLQVEHELLVLVLLEYFVADGRDVLPGERLAGDEERILVEPREQLNELPQRDVEVVGRLGDVCAVAVRISVAVACAHRLIDEQDVVFQVP